MNGYEVSYPPPEKLLLKHVLFGDCYCVKENDKLVFRDAKSSNVISTKGVDLQKTKFFHSPVRGDQMIFTFSVTINGGEPVEVAVPEKNKEDAEKRIRAKLGLTQDTQLSFVRETPDANTLSFEDLKGKNMKQGGDDSIESLKENVQEGQKPVQAETDPSKPILPPENSPGDQFDPSGQGQPSGNNQ